MGHAPNEGRKHYSFGSLGFSVREQPAGGPEPRLEFVSFASTEDGQLISALGALGQMLFRSAPDGLPWKTWDTVSLGNVPIRYRDFVLLPPPEEGRFSRYDDPFFSAVVSGGTQQSVPVNIVFAMPIPDSMADGVAEDSRSLPEWMRSKALHPAVGWERLFVPGSG